MPRIRCHYLDCSFLDDRLCSAAAVEIDPDSGCLTYSPVAGAETEDDWDEEKELEEWDQVEEEEEEETWLEEDEEY